MTEPLLLTQWAVCGIAAAAARFVPVPLLDDVIRRRAAHLAVVRTLRAHQWEGPSEQLQPLWGEPEGRSGLRRLLRKVPRRLLLFPVRKPVAVFGAVRGVPTDVMRVVLLARTVDRRLAQGGLRDGPGLAQEARGLRGAVDEALESVDLRLLRAALADGLSESRGLGASAVAFARRRFTRADPDAGLAPDDRIAAGAQRVTEVFRRPEIAQLLDRFDSQVDARLAAQEQT